MLSTGAFLHRRGFITRTALLLVSGAVIAACDDAHDPGACAPDPNRDDPDVGGLRCPAPADIAAPAPLPEVVTEPEPDPDDLVFLRSFE